MRLGSVAFLSALSIFVASVGTSAAQSDAAEKLTPPKKRNDWRSTFLLCEEGKKITALFAGSQELTVATPEGEYRLKRVKGAPIRYKNEQAEFVVQNDQAEFTSSKTGAHKACKPA